MNHPHTVSSFGYINSFVIQIIPWKSFIKYFFQQDEDELSFPESNCDYQLLPETVLLEFNLIGSNYNCK